LFLVLRYKINWRSGFFTKAYSLFLDIQGAK